MTTRPSKSRLPWAGLLVVPTILWAGSLLAGCGNNQQTVEEKNEYAIYARWHKIDSSLGRNYGEVEVRTPWINSAVPKVTPTGANALPDRTEYWMSVKQKSGS